MDVRHGWDLNTDITILFSQISYVSRIKLKIHIFQNKIHFWLVYVLFDREYFQPSEINIRHRISQKSLDLEENKRVDDQRKFDYSKKKCNFRFLIFYL